MLKSGNYDSSAHPARNIVRRAVSICGFLLAMLMPISSHVYAQQLGGVNGTATDPSGAVISNASVLLTNSETSVSYKTISSSAGSFTFINVVPGTYSVEIVAPTFNKYVEKGLRVEIGATSTVFANLRAGSAAQTVEVVAESVPLQTLTPEIGTVLEAALWEALPVAVSGAGRDVRQTLLSNTPGVQYASSGYGKIGGAQTGTHINYFNGLPQNADATMLPPYDMVESGRVDRTTFDAQWGWGVGALKYQTKSGTNVLHGSVFEINRNSFFDSKGFNNLRIPVNHQNNFGFAIGGPIQIPKLYNGRNRTFFYFAFERYMQNVATTGYATVPTAAMKTGDFSGLSAYSKAGPAAQAGIFDPLSADPYNPTQFQYQGQLNVIDPSRISPIAKSILQYIPDPNIAGTGAGGLQQNYYYSTSAPLVYNRYGLTIDEHLTESQSLNFAMQDSPTPQVHNSTTAIFGAPGSSNPLSGYWAEKWPGAFVYGNYLWAIRSNAIFTAGVELPFDYRHTQLPSEPLMTLASQNISAAPAQGFPGISFSGVDAPVGLGKGGLGSSNFWTPYYAAYSNINLAKGAHGLNFGWQGMYYKSSGFQCTHCVGTFAFNGNTTNTNISTVPGTFTSSPYNGSPFASFLLGQADSASISYSPPITTKYGEYAVYAQDAFKARPNLTLNAGLRWDIQVPYSTDTDRQDFVTPQSLTIPNSAASGQLGVLTQYGTCSICAGVHRAAIHWNEFAPRMGFSYAITNTTVASGSFSMLWQQYTNNNSNFTNDGNAFGASTSFNGNGTNQPGFGDWQHKQIVFPGTIPTFSQTALTGQGVGFFDPAVAGRDPYYELWNFGVQKQLPKDLFVRVDYVGQHGLHLVKGNTDLNVLPQGSPQQYGALLSQRVTSSAAQQAGIMPPFANFSALLGSSGTVGQSLKQYPQYTSISNKFPYGGKMMYHGLQMELDKRYSHGVSLLSGLTLQQNVGDAPSALGWDGKNINNIDPYNHRPEMAATGPAWFLSVAGTYDLPIGPGKMFLNNRGFTGEILGGWKLGWTEYYSGGQPMKVTANGSPYGFGNRAMRAAGVPIKKHSWSQVKDWAIKGGTGPYPIIVENNGAFTDPGLYTPGTSLVGITEMREPGYASENLQVSKNFAMIGRARGILRVDYFNLFNRWNLSNCMDQNISDANFGMVTNPKCGFGQRTGQATFRIEF